MDQSASNSCRTQRALSFLWPWRRTQTDPSLDTAPSLFPILLLSLLLPYLLTLLALVLLLDLCLFQRRDSER